MQLYLGRKLEHDLQSKNYPIQPRGLLQTIPKTVAHRDYRAAKMHLRQDCNGCTGWSMACVLNHRPFHKLNQVTQGNENGRTFYTWATQRDEWPGEYPTVDDGSSGLAAAQGLKDHGIISEYRWGFNEDQFWAGLMQGPISVGTNWYERMFEPASDGRIVLGGRLAGGHQYTINAYTKKLDLFRIDNSWGREWGLNGHAFIAREDLFHLIFNEQGDTVQLVR